MNRFLRVRTAVLALLPVLLAATAAAQDTPPVLSADRDYEMVLIHDLGARASVWDEVIPFLVGTFDVQTFELSGHGTTPPVRQPGIAAEVARLDAFMDANDIEYPTLVGHGLGGMIALRYALDHPTRIHRLILIDSAPQQLATEEQRQELLQRLGEDYDRFVAERALNMSPVPDVADKLVDMALRTDSASYIGLLRSTMDFDVRSELKNLSVPLLIIGSQMMFPDAAQSRAVLNGVGFGAARSLSFKRVAGTGHFIMLERPVYLASVLLAFGVTSGHEFDPDDPAAPPPAGAPADGGSRFR